MKLMRIKQTVLTTMRRVFAISDLHVDYRENREIVQQWSPVQYECDALIVAGDVTDSITLLQETLQHLTKVFHKVFFVPGNHELWLRKHEPELDSISKFHQIISICKDIGVQTEPELLPLSDVDQVWIVPLFSWYSTPEEDLEDSLFVKPQNTQCKDESSSLWMDNHMCKWPDLKGESRSNYFASLNSKTCKRTYSDPVLSFSHFLPRVDLIKPSEQEIGDMDEERQKLGLESIANAAGKGHLNPRNFNFTRYAGCKILDAQIRKINSKLHVFGHQHRNKDRVINGVRYISHCLGYKRERNAGLITGLNEENKPKQIWPTCQ